jgi:hypothetical protein
MKINDYRHKIIDMVRLLMQDNVIVGDKCGPIGTCTIQGGTSKKKYQFLKGEFALPHECIKEDKKHNIAVLRESFIMPFMIIPGEYSSGAAKMHKDRSKKMFDKELNKYPKIENALNALMQAIKEDLGD